MLKTLSLIVLTALGAQTVAADTTPASTNTTPAQVMATCEGPDALPRDIEPCASYWLQVQTAINSCMDDASHSRPAWHARYLSCSKLVRASFATGSQ